MSKRTERLGGVNTATYNRAHRPSDRLEDIEPMPGVLVLLRDWDKKDGPREPDKERCILLPEKAEDTLDSKYPPNCALVVAAGPGTVTPVGWYVFFVQRIEADKQYQHKPQPLSFEHSDRLPALWTIREEFVLARTPGRPK